MLGRLNLLYLNKPIACYYLVYVEVAPPFRKQGLGHRIIQAFTDFLAAKTALGLLDNIIPETDPTYDIYQKHGWRPLQGMLDTANGDAKYMVHVPPALAERHDRRRQDIREPIRRLVHHLHRKRAAIEMRDNEQMVRQTIAEFQDLYAALLTYFAADLDACRHTTLMRFMFTRYVTKLIGFRRRIGELLGYTGGESMEQIALAPEIAALPIQTYAPLGRGREPVFTDDGSLGVVLPPAFSKSPARTIEALPNYRRPSFMAWSRATGKPPDTLLTIGDLLDLGFDPTRLKELTLPEGDFIFERIQTRQIPDLETTRGLLKALESARVSAGASALRINPPILAIRDRGNAYVLRRRIPAIHWEEAIEQARIDPSLKALSAEINIERLINNAGREALAAAAGRLNRTEPDLRSLLTVFVAWDLEGNRPNLVMDFTKTFLESVWLA